MKITTLLVFVGVSALPLVASADPIAYAGFNTTPGNLDGTTGVGDIGFSDTWHADANDPGDGNNTAPYNSVVSGSLSYLNLLTTGNSATTTSSENAFDGGSLRTLSAPESGTFWVSFVYQSLGSGSGFNGLTLIDGGAGNNDGGLAFGQAYGSSTIGAFGDDIANYGVEDSGISSGSVAFIAANIDLADGTATWYVNPTGLGSGSTPTGSAFSSSYTFNPFSISGLGLRGNTPADFDEIRLGTTWADVSPVAAVPEPSSVALIFAGLGALVVIGRRRRSPVSL